MSHKSNHCITERQLVVVCNSRNSKKSMHLIQRDQKLTQGYTTQSHASVPDHFHIIGVILTHGWNPNHGLGMHPNHMLVRN